MIGLRLQADFDRVEGIFDRFAYDPRDLDDMSGQAEEDEGQTYGAIGYVFQRFYPLVLVGNGTGLVLGLG